MTSRPRPVPIRFVWLVACAAILTQVLASSALAATPIYVRPGGSDVNCNGEYDLDEANASPTADDCAVQTIQQGVDLVDAGGTVHVRAGSYNEDVNLNKSVNLFGDGASTTTVSGPMGGDGATLRVNALDVVIDGLTITRDGNNTSDWNNTTLNFAGIAIQGAGKSLEVRNSILTGNRTGIDINNNSGAYIHNSVIDFNHTGMILRNTTDDLVIEENEITNNRTVGILFLDASGGTNSPVQSALDSTITNNDISGNWYGGIVDRQSGGSLPPPGTTNLKDFSGNWLGTDDPVTTTADSAEPPYSGHIPVEYGGTATNPGGAPDVAGPASANFDYTPWLGDGTDTEGGTFGFQGDFSTLHVDDDGAQVGATGRVQEGVDAVSGSTVLVQPGSYSEDVTLAEPILLQGVTGGSFSSDLLLSESQAAGYWYPDRYPPGVFETATFMGEEVLKHGVRVADSAANRPSGFSSEFYDTQGRKLDTDLSGAKQGMSIDLWLDASWSGETRYPGIWSTGFDAGDAISAYPIIAWRSGLGDPEGDGFYAYDYEVGQWVHLLTPDAGDFDAWHELRFELDVGSGVEFFIDGESLFFFEDTDTVSLGNLILNVKNFAEDYDVYWDNWRVMSDGPATFEAAIDGQLTIDASDVEVRDLYLSHDGGTYGVFIEDHTPSHDTITLANNRIQNVGDPGLAQNVKGVYLNRGPDDVTIENNVLAHMSASTKSTNAIFVGDTASTDPSSGVIIRGNHFMDITSEKGAYGVLVNNGAGSPGIEVTDNAFSDLDGGWTHAVGLEGSTDSAVVTGNHFSELVADGLDNAAVFFEDNPDGDTVTLAGNLFEGDDFFGVALHPDDLPGGGHGYSYIVDAESNWWGSACGPSYEGPGNGARVSTQVDYSPWWSDREGSYEASEGPSGSLVIPDGATTEEAQAIIDCAGTATVLFEDSGATYPGGLVITNDGANIDLNGQTVGAGSPAFTVSADDVTIAGPGTLDGGGDASPAILVEAGADNLIVDGVEITDWADGIQVEGDVTSFKLVNSWLHDNADAGLQIDSGVSLGGIVTIEGNLFKDNGGNGIQNDGATDPLPAEYNSWGDIDGPTDTGDAGDGVSSMVDYDPWTFAEMFLDMDPATAPTPDETTVGVDEDESFDVTLDLDAENLYGITFQIDYDDSMLTLDGVAFASPWSGGICADLGSTPGSVSYYCNLISGPAWDASSGTFATLSFTAEDNGGLTGDGPWTNYLDIAHMEADSSTAAIGGVKVFLNNAGYGAPSVAARDITDTDDGQIDITGLANYSTFVDLQGRANDSGATLSVFDQLTIAGSTELANGASASSGALNTAHLAPETLTVGDTYYLQIDRDLFLPTTANADTDYAHSALLDTRPYTSLGNVVLLGGDAYNDNVIDIGDATCIGGAYGTSATTCGGGSPAGSSPDVNEDGIVDILDLVLMGGNYNLTASPWTP